MTRNRHIVDQLADVRAEIKTLQAKEDELKSAISTAMADRDSLGGDEFIAMQKVSERKGSIDAAAMKKDGIDVDKYRKPAVTVYQILVEPRAMEAAE